jgi:hypothetical protein
MDCCVASLESNADFDINKYYKQVRTAKFSWNYF